MSKPLEAAFFQLTGGANLTQLSHLADLAERHGEERCLEAIRIAGDRGVRKLSYAEAILRDWAANGYPAKTQPAQHKRIRTDNDADWSDVKGW